MKSAIQIINCIASVLISPQLRLQDNLFNISSVGINDELVINLSQRNSFHHQDEFYLQSYDFNRIVADFSSDELTGPWNFLKYEEGQYFHSHSDSQNDPEHFYTALLLPKNSFSSYQGGELFIHDQPSYKNSEQKVIISSDDLTTDILVIFPIHYYHEVLPVLSGTRYVFKKAIIINKSAYSDFKSNSGNRKFYPLYNNNLQNTSSLSTTTTTTTSDNTNSNINDKEASIMKRLNEQHKSRVLQSENPAFMSSIPVEFLQVVDGRIYNKKPPNKPATTATESFVDWVLNVVTTEKSTDNNSRKSRLLTTESTDIAWNDDNENQGLVDINDPLLFKQLNDGGGASRLNRIHNLNRNINPLSDPQNSPTESFTIKSSVDWILQLFKPKQNNNPELRRRFLRGSPITDKQNDPFINDNDDYWLFKPQSQQSQHNTQQAVPSKPSEKLLPSQKRTSNKKFNNKKSAHMRLNSNSNKDTTTSSHSSVESSVKSSVGSGDSVVTAVSASNHNTDTKTLATTETASAVSNAESFLHKNINWLMQVTDPHTEHTSNSDNHKAATTTTIAATAATGSNEPDTSYLTIRSDSTESNSLFSNTAHTVAETVRVVATNTANRIKTAVSNRLKASSGEHQQIEFLDVNASPADRAATKKADTASTSSDTKKTNLESAIEFMDLRKYWTGIQ